MRVRQRLLFSLVHAQCSPSHQSPPFTVGGTVLKESDDLVILEVIFDAFGVLSCPVLEYCSAMWCLDAYTHLKLLDRAGSGARL